MTYFGDPRTMARVREQTAREVMRPPRWPTAKSSSPLSKRHVGRALITRSKAALARTERALGR